jgi:hypothetical protein
MAIAGWPTSDWLKMDSGNCPDEWLLHPQEPPLCLTNDAEDVLTKFLEPDVYEQKIKQS